MPMRRLIACATLALLFRASLAEAQASGSAHASATVLASIIVTSQRDLDFGNVASSQVKTVAARQGGRFRISGAASTPVLIQFSALPAALGPNLTLGNWTGQRNTTSGNGGSINFTPSAGGSLAVTLSNRGRYFIRLGATLTASGAAPGSYSVPVVITVVYN